MALDKRLRKLESRLQGELITIRLKDGRTAILQCKSLLDVFQDVVSGKDTPETRLVLAAESSDEDGGMIELMQAIARSPDDMTLVQ